MTVIDPRKIDMVKNAHRHLPIKVGSDIALINAMMHIIIEEKLDKKKKQPISVQLMQRN